MRQKIKKCKEKILLALLIIFLGILYFSYGMTLTWDSSEYLGFADFIGTEQMQTSWIGHRGIAFPLLLKLFRPFGIENEVLMITLMFMFYVGMVFVIYLIYKKIVKEKILNNRIQKCIYWIFCILFIFINPIIFGYYHTLLTEFVSMTITILMCYLSWEWIDVSWEEEKKKTIVYAIVFAILAIFMYHTKQSLLPLILIPVLAVIGIVIVNKYKLENILTKILTFIFVIVMLIVSIIIWKFSMKDIDVIEATSEKRAEHLITGNLVEVTTKYYKNYIKIICWDTSLPLYYAKENYCIPLRIYENRENIVDVNEDYEQYIQNYKQINQHNFIAKIYNKNHWGIAKFAIVFAKINLLLLPITWVISIILFIMLKNKIKKEKLRILEFILILETTSFGGIMAYVAFNTTVDRYVIPMIIPVYIAVFLGISLLYIFAIKLC